MTTTTQHQTAIDAPEGLPLIEIVREFDAPPERVFRAHVDEDGTEYGFWGSFHEVREGELIVQTFGFDGAPDEVSLEKVTFEDLGNGRTRLRGISVTDSVEARDAMLASGMTEGINQSYEQLDELLVRR